MNHHFSVDNAVILAAGFASRFAPLSYHTPKALLPVHGEVLIERQIKQLQDAGIREIYVVTGYLKEKFSYLKNKYNVHLIENEEYETRNNHSSIWAAREVLANTYICSSDNYFTENVFTHTSDRPFYSALYADRKTKEWCLSTDETGRITKVTVGGQNAWYMHGHVLFDQPFSKKFLEILKQEYHLPETLPLYWESIYMNHLHELTLYIKKYPDQAILEFDNVEELSRFDPSYRKYL